MNERVVVLLAAHNGAPWIAEQVSSILDQTRVRVELIISDDASSDSTLFELTRFQNDSRVSVLKNKSSTGSAAKNFLKLITHTEISNADFIAFADQDDIWDPQKLSRGCEQISSENSCGYSCAVEAFWGDGRKRFLLQQPPGKKADYLFEGAGQGCTFILTAQFYARVKAFLIANNSLVQGIHYHDWLIYALSRVWQRKWTFDKEAMVSYRQHGDNDTGAKLSWHGLVKRLTLIRSGWYRHQLTLIAALCKSAEPLNADVEKWLGILRTPPGIARKKRALYFCWSRGGRRRHVDQTILLLSIVAGWI